MATRLKPTRINVDNTPRVWDGAAYQNDNDFHWSMGGWDMSYRDFEWHTLTGTSLVIEDISNNITPSSNFTVSAGTVKPGIVYVLRVNTGNTPYTMTLGTWVINPNWYNTTLTPNKVNEFKFIATSNSQLELQGYQYTAWAWINIDVNNEISNTLPWAIVSATAPSNPTEWMVWYDTAEDSLKAYNWTNWDATGKKYNAWPWIAIWAIHSDMQWPAPDGFHVPSRNEWIALFETLITTFSMTRNATTMGTYLKMPMAGVRTSSSSNVGGQGTTGGYRSSTPYSTNRAYYLEAYSSTIQRQSMAARTFGLSVRCFKDTPVTPDSSWTMLYDGSSIATWAGVYYSSALWLISVSWDWQDWLTIADKNLWATTVYNNWDTLSEANCWYYYQWGNNYGFPFTWTVTNSPTQVDASAYWPWNYYNSSTFITVNDWSTVQNDNLRWWVTQWVWVSWDWNTIVNTGVLSVNGQTWEVTVQETLVSGTNIKTINTQSLLWNGDITINWILSGPLTPTASATYAGRIWFNTTDSKFWKCDGTAWTEVTPVFSVNWNTWAVTVQETLVSGTNIKTINNQDILWSGNLNIWWDVQVSTQANNILTSWMKIWAGTEANYTNLWTYDSNTVYLTI